MNEEEKYMHIALDEARQGFLEGEIPIGCVIVLNGEVIGRGHNMTEQLNDATAHAEIMALRDASGAVKNWRLDNATAYVTVEPCPMCTAALIFARVKRIVFATENSQVGACGSVWNMPDDPAFKQHPVISSGVLKDDAQTLLQKFFAKMRE